MMDNNPSNEGHPESTNTEDNEHAENVEMPSHTDESLPAIPSSAPATPKADKTPKSKEFVGLSTTYSKAILK